MTKIIDLTGKRYGRLVVQARLPYKSRRRSAMWATLCDCGKELHIASEYLRSGNTQSCGCLKLDLLKKRNNKHCLSCTSEYKIWKGIIQRCTNPNYHCYPDYGGRGIQVCTRWRNSFECFFSDMGARPSEKHSIERRDNDGNYAPENCLWILNSQQQLNTRRNRYITFNTERKPISHWARELGISRIQILRRLRRGLPIEEVLRPRS